MLVSIMLLSVWKQTDTTMRQQPTIWLSKSSLEMEDSVTAIWAALILTKLYFNPTEDQEMIQTLLLVLMLQLSRWPATYSTVLNLLLHLINTTKQETLTSSSVRLKVKSIWERNQTIIILFLNPNKGSTNLWWGEDQLIKATTKYPRNTNRGTIKVC